MSKKLNSKFNNKKNYSTNILNHNTIKLLMMKQEFMKILIINKIVIKKMDFGMEKYAGNLKTKNNVIFMMTYN